MTLAVVATGEGISLLRRLTLPPIGTASVLRARQTAGNHRGQTAEAAIGRRRRSALWRCWARRRPTTRNSRGSRGCGGPARCMSGAASLLRVRRPGLLRSRRPRTVRAGSYAGKPVSPPAARSALSPAAGPLPARRSLVRSRRRCCRKTPRQGRRQRRGCAATSVRARAGLMTQVSAWLMIITVIFPIAGGSKGGGCACGVAMPTRPRRSPPAAPANARSATRDTRRR